MKLPERGTTDPVTETRMRRARLDTGRAFRRVWVKVLVFLLDGAVAGATAFVPSNWDVWDRSRAFAGAAIAASALSYVVVWVGAYITAPRRQFEDAVDEIEYLRQALNPPFAIDFDNPRVELDQGQHVIRVDAINRGPLATFGAYLADSDGSRNYQGRHRLAWSNESTESVPLAPRLPQPITVGFLRHRVVEGEREYYVQPTGPPFPEYHVHDRILPSDGRRDIGLVVEVVSEDTGQRAEYRMRVGPDANDQPCAVPED